MKTICIECIVKKNIYLVINGYCYRYTYIKRLQNNFVLSSKYL